MAVFHRVPQTLKAYNFVIFMTILDCKDILAPFVPRAIRLNEQIKKNNLNLNPSILFLFTAFLADSLWLQVFKISQKVVQRSKSS